MVRKGAQHVSKGSILNSVSLIYPPAAVLPNVDTSDGCDVYKRHVQHLFNRLCIQLRRESDRMKQTGLCRRSNETDRALSPLARIRLARPGSGPLPERALTRISVPENPGSAKADRGPQRSELLGVPIASIPIPADRPASEPAAHPPRLQPRSWVHHGQEVFLLSIESVLWKVSHRRDRTGLLTRRLQGHRGRRGLPGRCLF